MKMYNCLIVDDEPIAVRILESYLQDHVRVHVLPAVHHAEAARQVCDQFPVDLLLLDIEMPGTSGIDFLKSLENKPVTIMTTAYSEYALTGYELGVMDYLMKPVRPERLQMALDRAIEFLDLKQHGPALVLRHHSTVEIKNGARILELEPDAIQYVQGLKDYAILYTPTRRHVVRMTMKQLTAILEPFGFVRVHKSFIVSADKIPLIHRQKIEWAGVQIPVGRRFRP